jgi:hypothetical protein
MLLLRLLWNFLEVPFFGVGILLARMRLMQSNNKKKQKKRYGLLRESRDLQWLLRESLDLQNNQKGLGFHNIQHAYSLSRITLI